MGEQMMNFPIFEQIDRNRRSNPIIFMSLTPREIGDQGRGLNDDESVLQPVGWRIVREATKEEYLQHLKDRGTALTIGSEVWLMQPSVRFYELSLD
jgi:hypothetical protein